MDVQTEGSLETTNMRDRNGNPIMLGSRVVILKGSANVGEVGTIRAISLNCRQVKMIRVTDGPEGMPKWSSWRQPEDVALVEAGGGPT